MEGVLRVGVAWIPPTAGDSLPVTDAVDVAAVGEDFEWELQIPPPPGAMRHCVEIGCLAEENGETAAVGWVVAFVDRDGNGTAEVRVPDATPWSAAYLVAPGDDELVGLATDYAVAYTDHTLDPARGLAQTLGWPVPEGLSLMRVRHADGKDLLEPVVSRERVSIYLLPPEEGVGLYEGEEPGLCCGDTHSCDPDGVRCPTFQGQGVAVD